MCWTLEKSLWAVGTRGSPFQPFATALQISYAALQTVGFVVLCKLMMKENSFAVAGAQFINFQWSHPTSM